MSIFVSLSETDKRVIFILLLLIIVTLVILGYLGLLVTRIMKWQGRRVDNFTHDVVVTKVIDNKKDFLRYARKKNWVWFFKQAWKPLTIILVAFLFLLIHHLITRDWTYDLFEHTKTGFGTLLFIWDFNDPNIYKEFFGVRIIADWPPIISKPHWQWEAWVSYIFVPAVIIGGVWYLISVQCVVARTIRIHQLKHTVFDKTLENYNQNNPNNIIPPNNNVPPTNNNIPNQPNGLNQ
ncbi:MAG: hypothetical protein E7178_02295 [Erysipelotrichaceae bacterium]|jgi:hypothetical protein|nr:hypothetical protein [Erysipelotrichaceae bacterium]